MTDRVPYGEAWKAINQVSAMAVVNAIVKGMDCGNLLRREGRTLVDDVQAVFLAREAARWALAYERLTRVLHAPDAAEALIGGWSGLRTEHWAWSDDDGR